MRLRGRVPPVRATLAERHTSGDPRLSLDERYRTREGYACVASRAADALVRDRFRWSFDFDRHLAMADERVGRMVDQLNPDITAFKARGGKAIVYQGWQDPVVNALDTIAHYEQVRSRQGSQQETDGFFRLFMVPGVGHCAGGTGATNFGNQNAPAPVLDAEHDLLSALDAWVDKGGAVAARRLTGRQWRHGSHAATLRVSLEGYLCRHREHRRLGQLRMPIAAAVIAAGQQASPTR